MTHAGAVAVSAESTSTAEPSRDWSSKAFLASPRSRPPGMLVESLLPKESITMISAAPGTGKTFFTLAMAIALAQGTPFLGFKTCQSPVLFIGEDAPGWDYGPMLRSLCGSAEPPEGLHIAANDRFRMFEASWRDELGKYVQQHGIKIVVLDTLRSVHDKNENDSREMQQVMNEIRNWSVTYGVAVLFLHHEAKPSKDQEGSSYRGSSVLLGSTDFYFRMSVLPGGTRTGMKALALTPRKGRGRFLHGPITFDLVWDPPPVRIVRHSAVEAPKALDLASIVRAELETGPRSMEQLLAAVPNGKLSNKTLRTKIDGVLKPLREAGLVFPSRVGSKFVWRLLEAEKIAA